MIQLAALTIGTLTATALILISLARLATNATRIIQGDLPDTWEYGADS